MTMGDKPVTQQSDFEPVRGPDPYEPPPYEPFGLFQDWFAELKRRVRSLLRR